MIPAFCRKPRRSASICRYEDFELDLTSQKCEEKVTENSTKDTPIRHTPTPFQNLTEIQNVIENIRKKKDLEELCLFEKKKDIKNKLLKELYRNCSSNAVKVSKPNRNRSKSTEKCRKVMGKLSGNKSKGQNAKPKLKKQVSLVPSMKENKVKCTSIGKTSSRTYRNKSNDIYS